MSVCTDSFCMVRSTSRSRLCQLGAEDALESQHKNVRYRRLHNTRKTNRTESNTELLHCLLISTDPDINLFKQVPKPKLKKIDSDVVALLADPLAKIVMYWLTYIKIQTVIDWSCIFVSRWFNFKCLTNLTNHNFLKFWSFSSLNLHYPFVDKSSDFRNSFSLFCTINLHVV